MDKKKVNIIRVRQMLNEVDNYVMNSTFKFPTHVDLQVEENMKRKVNPFILQKCITHHIGGTPRSIRTKDKTTFLVEAGKQCES